MSKYETKVIQARHGLPSLQLPELIRYWDFLYFVTMRDIRVRYKQTILGFLWVAIQPITQMLIFTVIFGNIAQLDSEGIPYALYTFTALVPWGFFANTLNRSTLSVVGSANMIKKIYFPRLLLPISGLLSSLADFLIPFAILLGMLVWFGVGFSLRLVWLPALLFLAAITSLGAGLWLSALNVQFRDVRMAASYLVQIWFWISPVAYSDNVVQSEWELLYSLNPMTAVLRGFRWVLLGTGDAPDWTFLLGVIISMTLLISGLYYFRHMERTFADVV